MIVTGGASEIGLASARALAEVGRPVAIWDLKVDAAAKVAEQIAGQFSVPTLAEGFDVRDSNLYEPAIARAGGLPFVSSCLK